MFAVFSAVSCGLPRTLPNAQVAETRSYVYPENVVYTCETGYVLVNNDWTCGADGQFTGSSPVCEGNVIKVCCDTWVNNNVASRTAILKFSCYPAHFGK